MKHILSLNQFFNQDEILLESRRTLQQTHNIVGKENGEIIDDIISMDLTEDKMLISVIAFFYEQGSKLAKMRNTFAKASKLYDFKRIKVQYFTVAVKVNNKYFTQFDDFKELVEAIYSGTNTKDLVRTPEELSKPSKDIVYLQRRLDAGFEPTFDFFMKEVKANNIGKVKLLMKYVDPSTDDNAAFKAAAELNFTDMLDVLSSDSRVYDKLILLVNDKGQAYREIPKETRNSSKLQSSILHEIKTKIDNGDSDVTKEFATACSKKNGMDAVRYCLDNNLVDAGADDNAAIKAACYYGNAEVVGLLLHQPSVDPTATNNYCIRWAATNGFTRIVKMLLDTPNVDATAMDNSAIHYAAQNGHKEITKMLYNQPKIRSILNTKTPEYQTILKMVA